MDTFTCRSCGRSSRVRRVMVDAEAHCLVCEWCSAQNVYAVPAKPEDELEITGVRRALRQRPDGTVERPDVERTHDAY